VVACRKPLLGRGAKETTNMQRRKAITKDEGVMLGKPTVAGTRLTVELILEKLAAGEGVGQIVEAYPRLDREAVREALLFAAGEGEIVARLRSEGHDVAYVPEISAGIRNDEVLARANEEGRVLLTEDKDFGDLAFFYGNRSLASSFCAPTEQVSKPRRTWLLKSWRHTRTNSRRIRRTSSCFGGAGRRDPFHSATSGPEGRNSPG
jgi:uncharacterized protein (DUF433 family)